MTLSLTHPLTGEPLEDARLVEAAHASMAYWNHPAPVAEVAAKNEDQSALDQMFAYFD